MNALEPVQHPAVPLSRGRRSHGRRVATRSRFGQAPARQLLAFGQRGQKPPLLILRRKARDVRGAQTVVRRHRQGDARIDARQLLDADAIVDGRHAGAAILRRELNPHQSQRGHLREQRRRKSLRLVPLPDERLDFALGKLAHAATQERSDRRSGGNPSPELYGRTGRHPRPGRRRYSLFAVRHSRRANREEPIASLGEIPVGVRRVVVDQPALHQLRIAFATACDGARRTGPARAAVAAGDRRARPESSDAPDGSWS